MQTKPTRPDAPNVQKGFEGGEKHLDEGLTCQSPDHVGRLLHAYISLEWLESGICPPVLRLSLLQIPIWRQFRCCGGSFVCYEAVILKEGMQTE